MWLLYDILIHLYGGAARVAALFNPKAGLWVSGRKHLFRHMQTAIGNRTIKTGTDHSTLNIQPSSLFSLAWFHCASLGEFEQGRPVIETFRQTHPDWKILLTFYSPSGYEQRKNYPGADWIFYLPLDTSRNARKFIDIVNPDLVVFVKYEFWFHYMDILYRKSIPVYVISANFRHDQHFFKWYGYWSRNQLKKVTRFFVQHENSSQLLRNFGLDRVTVSGDTRFDRVASIKDQPGQFPLIEIFASQMPVFLAGSTWPADEEIILKLIRAHGNHLKFIIAPHEVGQERVNALRELAGNRQSNAGGVLGPTNPGTGTGTPESRVRLFSELTEENAADASIVIADGIGYLSKLYRYATIAYIGGGFGAGIHNILEAAAFGIPVIFGPRYQKFLEAVELKNAGGAFSINNFDQLNERTSELLKAKEIYTQASDTCQQYVQSKKGATAIILNELRKASQ